MNSFELFSYTTSTITYAHIRVILYTLRRIAGTGCLPSSNTRVFDTTRLYTVCVLRSLLQQFKRFLTQAALCGFQSVSANALKCTSLRCAPQCKPASTPCIHSTPAVVEITYSYRRRRFSQFGSKFLPGTGISGQSIATRENVSREPGRIGCGLRRIMETRRNEMRNGGKPRVISTSD